jgi:adenosylmethionine-8-amino-7-oxononanoate aminotransferase
MANPLAAAISLASIDLLISSDWQPGIEGIAEVLHAGLAPLESARGVLDVRVLGAIGVVQLDHQVDVVAATAAAVAHGVWLRPFRDLIYTMPPYITSDADLASISVAIHAAVEASTDRLAK